MNTSVKQSDIKETMNSSQLAELLGIAKKHVNVKIRTMFNEEIEGREIRLDLSLTGQVSEYYLSELYSTMFVGRWHTPFLRQLAEFWISRNALGQSKEVEHKPYRELDEFNMVIAKCRCDTEGNRKELEDSFNRLQASLLD